MTKVAKKDETKVSVNVINLEDDAGAGLEQIKSSDLKVPYMKLLQSSSDETKKGSEKHIPNAEPGDLYIESTGQVFGGENGVKAVQVYYENTWNGIFFFRRLKILRLLGNLIVISSSP